MDLELQNYKSNHEIFGEQKQQDSRSSLHSMPRKPKDSTKQLIQRVSYLS
jgi:hypothetical protein